MKKALLILFSLCLASPFLAQETEVGPVEYMEALGKDQRKISENFLRYTSAQAHSKNMANIESKRQRFIQSIQRAKDAVQAGSSYNGDDELRQAMITYLDYSEKMMNDDYGALINMEKVSEESYSSMEAYILANEAANKKHEDAYKKLTTAKYAFANRYEIDLVNAEDELSRKLKEVENVNNYYHAVFLIFFKAYRSGKDLDKALQENNLEEVERQRAIVNSTAIASLDQLDAHPDYKGDSSLKDGARGLIQALIDETSTYIPLYVAYENFSKQVEEAEARVKSKTPKTNASKGEIAKYNKAVDAYNSLVKESKSKVNKLNAVSKSNYENKLRQLNMWELSIDQFMHKHIPVYGGEEEMFS